MMHWNLFGARAYIPTTRIISPRKEKVLNEPPFDPKKALAATITCNNRPLHYAGKRPYTVREMALLQGFKPDYQFTGTRTQVREQIGNAWGPPGSTKQLLQCAATQEAFDLGLIAAGDDIHDLYAHLQAKGVVVPGGQAATPIDLVDDAVTPVPRYRYINQLTKKIRPRVHLLVFAKGKQLASEEEQVLGRRRNA